MIAMALVNNPQLLIADEPPRRSTSPFKHRSSICWATLREKAPAGRALYLAMIWVWFRACRTGRW